MRPMQQDGYGRSVWKGAVAGLAGGLIGSWAMNEFQAVWSRLSERGGQEQPQPSSDEPATVKAASEITKAVAGRELTKEEKPTAGSVVHYAFGGANGLVYGALAEEFPDVRAGAGACFGATLWAVADEGLVPALGWSKPPAAYPASVHAYALASHLVYGLTTEAARRVVRRML